MLSDKIEEKNQSQKRTKKGTQVNLSNRDPVH
jgi:hypothetical protein